LSTSRIELLPPVPKASNENWFVQITNGKFFANVGTTLRKYYIAEFLSQTFNPEYPIKSITDEEATILSKSLIKLDYSNIREDSDLSLYINIIINDVNDDAVAAFTTDSSLVGTTSSSGALYQKWSSTSRVGIRSIDHKTGYLDIEGLSIKSNYIITCSYYFDEVNYEYTLLDFNPLTSLDSQKKTTLFQAVTSSFLH